MKRDFVFGVICAILTIILIVCSIIGFVEGVGWTAWLWMAVASVDGFTAIGYFCAWWEWRSWDKWMNNSQ